MDARLPPDQLRKVLLDHVGDLEELQVLACFHRAESKPIMTLEEVAAGSHLPESSALQALEGLVARRLVAPVAGPPTRYRYAPPDEETRALLRRVADDYRADPLGVIKVMASNAIDRVRSAALRTFAEAFRLKGPR